MFWSRASSPNLWVVFTTSLYLAISASALTRFGLSRRSRGSRNSAASRAMGAVFMANSAVSRLPSPKVRAASAIHFIVDDDGVMAWSAFDPMLPIVDMRLASWAVVEGSIVAGGGLMGGFAVGTYSWAIVGSRTILLCVCFPIVAANESIHFG